MDTNVNSVSQIHGVVNTVGANGIVLNWLSNRFLIFLVAVPG